MGEIVVDPDALEAFAASSRRRLLAVDTSSYEGALAELGAARADLDVGDVDSQTGRILDTLSEWERVNRSVEAFASAMAALDRSSQEGGGVVRTSLSRGDFFAMLADWQRAFNGDLLAAASAITATRGLSDAVAAAADPTLSPQQREAAQERVKERLDELLDLGVGDDPALQAAVITSLGPDGVEAFSTALAVAERDAGKPVPWVRAGMELLAGWTASAANSYSQELGGFLDQLPPELITTLSLLAPWNAAAGAQAAANVWARPSVGGRLAPVVPASLAHRGWPAPSGNGDRAAMILATNHPAAHALLTDNTTILADLVAATDHPAAAAAVTAGLITHPRRMFATGGDTDAIGASAGAFAGLMDHDAGLGHGELTEGGRGVLARVAGFHFGLMDAGVRPSANAFLGGADGTYAPLVDDFLHQELAANPAAVAAVATQMHPGELGQLIATLSDDNVQADGAILVVGEDVSGRLGEAGAAGKAALLVEMGPDGLADLSASAVRLDGTNVLRGLGVGYADALTAMSTSDQVRWLDMMAVADNNAGYAAVLLANSDGFPGNMLSVFLSQESPTFLLPRSDEALDLLTHQHGDWRLWNRNLYNTMLNDHRNSYALVADVTRGRVEVPLTDVDREQIAARFSSGSVSPGFSSAFSDYLFENPLELNRTLDELDADKPGYQAEAEAVMWLVEPANRGDEVVDAYAAARIQESLDRHGSLFSEYELTGEQHDDLAGRFGADGERLAQLQASRPDGVEVDLVDLGRLIAVEASDDVPILGRALRYGDNAWTVAESIDLPTTNDYDPAARARSYEALDYLTDASPNRELILRSFGFEMDGDEVVSPPNPSLDPNATADRYPQLRTLLSAANAFGDGLKVGRP